MEFLIFASLVVLILLVVRLLLQRKDSSPEELKASLRQEFLSFQTGIHAEIGAARQSMDVAKDVVANQAIQTISQIQKIGDSMNALAKQQEEAQKLGQGLKDLLQGPKLRGNYGEAVLEEILARVLPAGIWERQYSIEGNERVDCIVRFRDVIVPIDAKFPRDDYTRYADAESEEDKARHWKSFETAVKTQIASIQSKYIKPEYGTTDFALMFIPSEAVYYELIAEQNKIGTPSSLLQYAQDLQVLPVSPNTFYAFLQIIVMGIQNTEMVSKARELKQSLANLDRTFGFFYTQYQEMGKGIDKAAEAYRKGDMHVDRFKKRLDSTLQMEGLQQDQAESLSEAK